MTRLTFNLFRDSDHTTFSCNSTVELGGPMKKKARATGTVKYRFSVLKMVGKFNYVIEGEDSEIYIQKYTKI